MALQDIYKQFLSRPSAEQLAEEASLHYIPTLSSFKGGAAVVKHLLTQERELKKKKEDQIKCIEDSSNLCVETITTLEFVLGGGSYLPGLDDNFLADRVVEVPIVHIVSFDSQQKIKQIRLFWDQASLLKAVEVIGSRGKNWPVFDGKEQSRVVSSSVASESRPSTSNGEDRVGRRGDPHTSLSLFKAREMNREESPRNAVDPRISAKPAERDYHDLFAAGMSEGAVRSPSPSKASTTSTLKSGAGKHFQGNRLFEDDQDKDPGSPSKPSIVVNPRKFNHFEFGDAADADPSARPGTASSKSSISNDKRAAHWSLEDSQNPATPKERKSAPRENGRNERHFGWSDNEEEANKPSVHRKVVHRPRPDAAVHFEFNDEKSIADKKPLGNITNQAQHRKNLSSQLDINDESISTTAGQNENKSKPTATQQKVLKTLEPAWQLHDETPQKERGIKIFGDGMGSRKTGEKHWWDYDE